MVINSVRLLYFSPTGTTRKVLEAISDGLGVDKPKHIDLTSPGTRTGRSRKIQGGLTIIGVPVYTGRVALEAVRGLQRFKAKDAPAVIVAVYGNREYEDALLELQHIATEAGFTPIAGAVFIGEHSFSTDGIPIAQGRPDASDLDRARSFGTMVQKKINNMESLCNVPPLTVPGNFPYRERGPTRDTSPETSDALCIRCGKCVEVCPVATITLKEDGVTTDKEKCTLCCACVKNCPTEARRLEDPLLTQFIREKLSAMCSNRKEPEFYM
jgi:ferredoxin